MERLYAEKVANNNNNGPIETHIATWLSNNPILYDISIDDLIELDKLRESRNSAAQDQTTPSGKEKISEAIELLPEGRLKNLVNKIVRRVV